MKTAQETVSYAQNREDLIIAGFFEVDEDGFYVDVGANDPDKDSVTKLFYEQGWHGMNIEPLAWHFKQLQQQRPRDINLNVGLSDKPGEGTLHECVEDTKLSTFSAVAKKGYEGDKTTTAKHVEHRVKLRTLAQIFGEHEPSRISFMKVAAGGYEYQVLAGNDWEKYRPQLLCVRASDTGQDWRSMLKKHKYQKVFFDGLNEYFVAEEQEERAKQFSYVNAVIKKQPVVTYQLLPKLQEHEQVWQTVRSLEHEAEIKQQSIVHLEGIINEITPLRRHAVRQVKSKLRKLHHKIVLALGGARAFTPSDVDDTEGDLLAQARANDTKNFHAYNASTWPPLPLRIYLGLCRRMVALLKWLLRFRRT
ncbi:MAG: FkbM family methyltransferase [Candidatus Saccharimonadales bacterium]